ncbi:MAG: hypothetical protein RJA63_2281 [Pseudomonadota bacterium]|jgi:DNA-binding response OmpR family regulator
MHLLIIEDDLDLGLALQRALKAEGITSEWLRRAGDVSRQIASEPYDCVLLDLGLPDAFGLDVLKRWRSDEVRIPVIVITARTSVEDRVRGLDLGADDFVIKPFAMAELVSRIRAVTRRFCRQTSEVWTVGALRLEPKRHFAELDGLPLNLSPREFQLLQELVREAGVVVTKHSLAQRLVPLGEALDFGAIEVHIFNLRRKIGAHRIRTVRGVGYMLEV